MREDELVGKLDRRYRLVMEASRKAGEGQPAPTDFRISLGHWDSEERKDEIPNPQMPWTREKHSVDLRGIEPLTSPVRGVHSTN